MFPIRYLYAMSLNPNPSLDSDLTSVPPPAPITVDVTSAVKPL